MSIQSNELKYRKAAVNTDGASNGGRMSSQEIASGVSQNVLPNVSKQERTAGVTRYRKIFLHVSNVENLTYIDPSVFIDKFTPGDDRVSVFTGTQTDTQSSITGTERQYGSGQLDADVSAGGQAISVATEAASLDIFKNGDKIRISDMDNVESGTGNDQIVTINSSVSYAGDVASFTIEETLNHNFTAATTRVMSLIRPGDMSTSVDGWAESTAGSGTFDEATFPVEVANLSGIEQAWTLTVSNGATTFTVVGDTVGNLGDFAIGSDIDPSNPDFLSPYFVLRIAGLAGSWADGDTITFSTHPNSLPLWIKQVVPAGAVNLTGNLFTLGTEGESA
ncbi:MAG: hypothetical protein LPH21_12925 [Shewanella sp.]|nr:hypothetical protein [Shewanella sp.]